MRRSDSVLGILVARFQVWPIAAMLAFLALSASSHAAQPVLQRGYDASVSGANLTETVLNTSNVGPDTFGLLFKLPVDDTVYAQPLYVPNVLIPNQGNHNVVYVATMSDSIYAFDADAGGAPLWAVNYASLFGTTPVSMANFVFNGSQNIPGQMGILSTPVIDPVTAIMYFVTCTLENNTMAYRLRAVDITTGYEVYVPGGTLIAATFSNLGITVNFNAIYETQRVSLVLAGNQVVFGFGAMESEAATASSTKNVGWVMAYDKHTLQQSGAFATVLQGSHGGGVWQSGRPPVVDASGYVYVFTGNGYNDGHAASDQNYSESAIKLNPADPNGLSLSDWFTPANWSALDASDLDLSSSGPLLIPGTNPPLLAGGGKNCELYLLSTTGLGQLTANDTGAAGHEVICAHSFRGGPVYWQRSAANGGPLLYNWGSTDVAKAYAFTGTQLATSPTTQGNSSTQSQIWPGGILTLSANGEQHGSGVLWATVATSGDANDHPPVPGALRAFNAEDLTDELWNSTWNLSRDDFGDFAKFAPPLVANGKVYVATWSDQLAVYGLLAYVAPESLVFASQMTGVASAPQTVTVTNSAAAAVTVAPITLSGANPGQFSQSNSCGAPIAAGSSCSISVVFNPTSPGRKKATLSVNAGSGTQTVALTGAAVAPPYTLSPSSLAFGSETVANSSAPQMITATNTGSAPLAITSIALANTGSHPFSQTNNCGTSIPGGSSCTISVVFSPTSTGPKPGKVTFNAGSAGTTVVTLTGSGATAPYTLSPTSLAFGSQQHGTSSAPQAVTLTNTSGAALPITSVALSTTSPHPFSETNTCGNSVPVGATCTISVVFSPSATGARTAKLSVNAGGGAGTQSVTLSGTGT